MRGPHPTHPILLKTSNSEDVLTSFYGFLFFIITSQKGWETIETFLKQKNMSKITASFDHRVHPNNVSIFQHVFCSKTCCFQHGTGHGCPSYSKPGHVEGNLPRMASHDHPWHCENDARPWKSQRIVGCTYPSKIE